MTDQLKTHSTWDGRELFSGFSASENEINLTIKKAKRAFPSWAKSSLWERFSYLQKFQDKLTQMKELFAKIISEETGKPFWEAKTEVDAMIKKVDIASSAFKQRTSPAQKKKGDVTINTFFRPHGVLAVLGPFNFPGHLPNGHIIPALLAGNTIVFKPSEKTAATGSFYHQIWQESNLPEAVFNLIQGDKTSGHILSSHKELDGLLFTGSFSVGKQLAKQFAETPGKILALEMGGNNPLVIEEPIKNMDAAIYIIVQSAFITSGQRCSAARRLILPKSSFGDKLLEKLIAAVKKIRIGPPTLDPEPYMGPLISEEAASSVLKTEKQLISLGGNALLKATELPYGKNYLTPSIIDVTNASERIDEECFGPLLQVIRVENFKEALAEADNTAYGLTAGLVSDSVKKWEDFKLSVKAGVLSWNMPITGASSETSFGGLKNSGNLRPSAYFAADYCATPIASQETKTANLPAKLPDWLHS